MALTKMQKEELSRHFWRVSTDDTLTQQAITDELARQGESSGSQTNIFHGGVDVPVFIVKFKMVEFLSKNKDKVPYSFTAYHRKNRSGGWHIWKEGRETVVQKLMKEIPVSAQELKAAALKKKKRDRLIIKKSALAAM